MPTNSSFAGLTGAVARELDDVLEEISRLSKSNTAPSEFLQVLLDRAVTMLAAAVACVWEQDSSGGLTLVAQAGTGSIETRTHEAVRRRREQLIRSVFATQSPRIVSPDTRTGLANNSPCADRESCLFCPVVVCETTVAIIEVDYPCPLPPESQDKHLRFLLALCELTGDYYSRRELRDLRWQEDRRARTDKFVRSVHESLDLDSTAYAIANDGRRLADCHRLSVLEPRGGRMFRVLAVSGADVIDRRSSSVRLLQRLASTALVCQDELWYPEDSGSLAPQVQSALQAYLDQAHARRLGIVALRDERETAVEDRAIMGALVAEAFDLDQTAQEFATSLRQVARYALPAFRNALTYERLPFSSLSRLLHKAGWPFRADRIPKTLLAAVLAVVSIILLWVIPADFRIEGRGELQPRIRRDVFARHDAIVDRLLVRHASKISAGDVLVETTSSQLDLEASRVIGELQTAQTQLASLRGKQWIVASDDTSNRENLLAGELENAKERITGLEQQRKILDRQRAELTVRSPIGGQVLTWNVSELLADRPVRRGQLLLTVADSDGPWVLEMHVADKDIGHVLAATRDARNKPEVSFMLATDPAVTYRGRVDRIAGTTDVREDGSATVRVTAVFDRDNVSALRPGASVLARIECGRRSIAYVWLHDLIDAVRWNLNL